MGYLQLLLSNKKPRVKVRGLRLAPLQKCMISCDYFMHVPLMHIVFRPTRKWCNTPTPKFKQLLPLPTKTKKLPYSPLLYNRERDTTVNFLPLFLNKGLLECEQMELLWNWCQISNLTGIKTTTLKLLLIGFKS